MRRYNVVTDGRPSEGVIVPAGDVTCREFLLLATERLKKRGLLKQCDTLLRLTVNHGRNHRAELMGSDSLWDTCSADEVIRAEVRPLFGNLLSCNTTAEAGKCTTSFFTPISFNAAAQAVADARKTTSPIDPISFDAAENASSTPITPFSQGFTPISFDMPPRMPASQLHVRSVEVATVLWLPQTTTDVARASFGSLSMDPATTSVLQVSSHQVGFILGRGGTNIREMREKSGAKIQMDTMTPNGWREHRWESLCSHEDKPAELFHALCNIMISGTEEQRQRATHLIATAIQNGEAQKETIKRCFNSWKKTLKRAKGTSAKAAKERDTLRGWQALDFVVNHKINAALTQNESLQLEVKKLATRLRASQGSLALLEAGDYMISYEEEWIHAETLTLEDHEVFKTYWLNRAVEMGDPEIQMEGNSFREWWRREMPDPLALRFEGWTECNTKMRVTLPLLDKVKTKLVLEVGPDQLLVMGFYKCNPEEYVMVATKDPHLAWHPYYNEDDDEDEYMEMFGVPYLPSDKIYDTDYDSEEESEYFCTCEMCRMGRQV